MLAYVELVQRKEKEIGCDVLTHQKWYASSSSLSALALTSCDFIGAVRTTSTAFWRAYPLVPLVHPLLAKIPQNIPFELQSPAGDVLLLLCDYKQQVNDKPRS